MKKKKVHIVNNNIPPTSPIIAKLNDDLRCFGLGGRVVVTRGVMAQGQIFVAKVLRAIQRFDAFDERNDPYEEHDCALVQVDDQSLIWKIDTFDTAVERHSPDPCDPQVTCRVLTVMLADEY